MSTLACNNVAYAYEKGNGILTNISFSQINNVLSFFVAYATRTRVFLWYDFIRIQK